MDVSLRPKLAICSDGRGGTLMLRNVEHSKDKTAILLVQLTKRSFVGTKARAVQRNRSKRRVVKDVRFLVKECGRRAGWKSMDRSWKVRGLSVQAQLRALAGKPFTVSDLLVTAAAGNLWM
jgi:hypothetical protein